MSLLEQGRQQDLDAHLVGLLLLWRLDQLADYGGDGGFTGRGRDRGGPAVCSRDVVQPDGTRDLEHGVDVTLVVGAAGADDDVRDQHVVRLLLRDEAGFLGSVDGGQEPGSVSRPVASRMRPLVSPSSFMAMLRMFSQGAVFEIAALQGGHVGF